MANMGGSVASLIVTRLIGEMACQLRSHPPTPSECERGQHRTCRGEGDDAGVRADSCCKTSVASEISISSTRFRGTSGRCTAPATSCRSRCPSRSNGSRSRGLLVAGCTASASSAAFAAVVVGAASSATRASRNALSSSSSVRPSPLAADDKPSAEGNGKMSSRGLTVRVHTPAL